MGNDLAQSETEGGQLCPCNLARTTVRLQLLLIPEARDLDNGSWGYEWALDSRMYLDEVCHALCTRHFSWNRQDQPIVGMSKLLRGRTY